MPHDGNRFDSHRPPVLSGAERWAYWDPLRFFTRLGLQAGQSVLDLGSGPGFFTLPLADNVGPTGHVWALDASQDSLDALASRNPPPQVHLLRIKVPTIALPKDSIDLAWTAYVFHQVEHPQRLARGLRRVVKASGRVLLLELRPGAKREKGIPREDCLMPKQVIAWFRAAGFTRVGQKWQDPDNYLIEGMGEKV